MFTQNRAKKGGEVGINGEFYEGGKFIPTANNPKQHKLSRKKVRKQEIAPYKWEFPPSPDAEPIFCQIAVFCIWHDYHNGGDVTIFNHDLGETAKIKRDVLERLVQKFNAGERWIEF